MSKIRFFGSFEKLTKQDDGTIVVEGIASSEAVDSDGEVVKADAMRSALPDFMKFGNIREMHGPNAAGVALDCSVGNDGRTVLKAHIVDPVAVKKCETGVYKGFSIGGRILPDGRDPENRNIVTAIKLSEISLVDRPANPEAVFTLGKVAERDDTNPNEGENKYGDVKFADEKNKKYPIDTPAHIRAAWNYINKPKNAGEYSEEDANSIKDKIIAAWKDKIDSKGPPSADDSEKCDREMRAALLIEKVEAAPILKAIAALRGDKLAKGLYAVSSLACLLSNLYCLAQDCEMEAQIEGDGSVLPDELKESVKNLGEILVHMADEEVEELYGDDNEDDDMTLDDQIVVLAEKIGTLRKAHDELAKAGAKHSAATMEKLQGMHDTLSEMTGGAVCKDDEESEKMQKAHGVIHETTCALKKMQDENAELKKALANQKTALDAALAKAAKWDALPASPKAPAMVVEKGAAQAPAAIEPVKKRDGTIDHQATAKEMIAAQLRTMQ